MSEERSHADHDFVTYIEARTPALLRLAYLLSGDRHLAEDLVQEVLAKAHRRWDRVSRADHPHAYVRRMVVTQLVGWRRRRSAHELALSSEAMPDGGAPDAQEAVAARDAAWRAMAGLPARQRSVLVLRYYEDLSDDDIAEVLGCAVGTVRSLASRAFSRLRDDPQLADYAAPLAVGPHVQTVTPEENP